VVVPVHVSSGLETMVVMVVVVVVLLLLLMHLD